MKYLLECPRCLQTRYWDSDSGSGPGKCSCNSYQHWRVRKEPRPRGYVIVYSDKGKQELHAKYNWQEHPDAWKPK